MQNRYELIKPGYCVCKQGRACAVRVLGLPLFELIFARKNEFGTCFFRSRFEHLFHKKTRARIVRAGGREFE